MNLRKIAVNTEGCGDWALNQDGFSEAIRKGAEVPEGVCKTCRFNLFTYCQFEDRDTPLVIRALQGNYDARKKIHDKIRCGRGS